MPSIKKWTEQEYLAFERDSGIRHEFFQGEIFAMSGASKNHNRLVASTLAHLFMQLRGKECEVLPSDMRVKIPSTRHYTYPDIVIVCGTLETDDAFDDTLLNPTVIIEVLSPSTKNDDRGEKFLSYRALDSLQEYVLIAQDAPHVERYLRQPDNQWLLADITGLQAHLELTSIHCTLALADIYERVTFEAYPEEDDPA